MTVVVLRVIYEGLDVLFVLMERQTVGVLPDFVSANLVLFYVWVDTLDRFPSDEIWAAFVLLRALRRLSWVAFQEMVH